MRTLLRGAAAAWLALTMVACGGGGGDSGEAAPAPILELSGQVVAMDSDEGVQNARVMLGDSVVVSTKDGSFRGLGVPSGRQTVRVSASGYVDAFTPVTVAGTHVEGIRTRMVRAGPHQLIDPGVAATVGAPGSPASLSLPANSLVVRNGSERPDGAVTVRLTVIHPAAEPASMPGDYTAAEGERIRQIESFGALKVDLLDGRGRRLDLAAGKRAQIRIPFASRSSAAPDTVPLFYFDETAGLWRQEGSASLVRSPLGEPLYYEGEVTHFSYWNADLAYEVVLYESCVNDENGDPYPGVQVQASGVEYSGTASAQTGADGKFTVGVRPNSRAVLQASLNGRVSPLRPIARTAVDFVEVACLTLPRTPATPGTGSSSDSGMAPVVVRDPEAQQVVEEQSAVLRAYAMGSPVLEYRWQRNGADLANGDGRHHIVSTGGSSMLFVDRAALQDNGAVYSVKVSNRLGSATSQSAVLSVRTEGRAPFVLAGPDPVSLVAGQRASFAVVAGGSPTLQYRWLRDGVEIAGAQGTEYTTQALSPADDGSLYSVRVANPYGQTTSPAALVRVSQTATVPTLVREPQDTAVYVGSSATFSVVAQGTGPLLYQWQRDGSDIAGANMPDLTLHDAGLGDRGPPYGSWFAMMQGR